MVPEKINSTKGKKLSSMMKNLPEFEAISAKKSKKEMIKNLPEFEASKKKNEIKKPSPNTTGVPYPFRTEAEKIAYGKNMERIVKPGYGEMGRKARPMSEMSEMAKPDTKPMTNVKKKIM